MKTKFTFRLSVETDDATGEVLAVYFQFRRGKTYENREFENGDVFADYNQRGELLGVEFLAPASVAVLNKVASQEPPDVRRKTKRFVRDSGPRAFITT